MCIYIFILILLYLFSFSYTLATFGKHKSIFRYFSNTQTNKHIYINLQKKKHTPKTENQKPFTKTWVFVFWMHFKQHHHHHHPTTTSNFMNENLNSYYAVKWIIIKIYFCQKLLYSHLIIIYECLCVSLFMPAKKN